MSQVPRWQLVDRTTHSHSYRHCRHGRWPEGHGPKGKLLKILWRGSSRKGCRTRRCKLRHLLLFPNSIWVRSRLPSLSSIEDFETQKKGASKTLSPSHHRMMVLCVCALIMPLSKPVSIGDLLEGARFEAWDLFLLHSPAYPPSRVTQIELARSLWGRTKSDSETALYSETSLQKLFRCIRKLFRCIQKLLYSETISSYSETLFVVFRNYFVVFRNYFVVFRNYCRRIQKLFSSYSETIFVVFRNYCSSCSETSIPKLGGNVNNRARGQLMRSLEFRVGWGGWAGAVSFRRWLRGPMLSWVRVGWGKGAGGWGRRIKLMWIVAYHGGRVGCGGCWGSKLP